MSEKVDQKVLVCPPWNAGDASWPGSTAKDCGNCGTSVVVSVSGLELLREDPEVVPVCAKCMEEASKTIPTEMLVTPQIRQEVADRLGLSLERVDELIQVTMEMGAEEAARIVRERHEPGQN